MTVAADGETPRPVESLGALFWRFLRFGVLAWGGPVAQIAMIRQELVEEERWISRGQFNRILAVYQVLPGPEAHELCVFFGMLARGRVGGFLAGLAFMLPGFILMFVLSALYVTGERTPLFQAVFLGIQPAVVALIFRAVHRLSGHALTNPGLWGIALLAAIAQVAGTSFWVTLTLSGLLYLFLQARRVALAVSTAVLLLAAIAFLSEVRIAPSGVSLDRVWEAMPGGRDAGSRPEDPTNATIRTDPSQLQLFVSGLRSGLLTFGGAYTVVPFLQRDAVETGRWMTNEEFLDGVALSGIIPAPFIIFSTFVGYLGGGPAGALVLTVGIFLPAFAFTLAAHDQLERLVGISSVHTFLNGVTAGVVGLIAAVSLMLFRVGVRDLRAVVIFALALTLLYLLKTRWAVAVVILAFAGIGALTLR